MADKLSIYREALRHLGGERLSSLTEVRPERITFDDVWASAVRYVLNKGLWNFATRTVELTYDEDLSVTLGYTYGFSKPTDSIRTAGVSLDGTFNDGFEDYKDENGYLYASVESFYLQYISVDTDFGMNLGLWPEPFAKAVAVYLAYESALPVSSDKGTRADMYQLFSKLLKEAKSIDAAEDRVKRAPVGRLVRSRFSGHSGTGRGL